MTLFIMRPDAGWRFYNLSGNPKLLYSFVLTHPHLDWSYDQLASNSSVTFSDILLSPVLLQCGDDISLNPNVTINDVLAHPEIEWNFKRLSYHPNITPAMVFATPQLPWSIRALSRNPNTTIETMIAHPSDEWDLSSMIMNPLISIAKLLPCIADDDHYDWDIYTRLCNRLCLDAHYVRTLSSTLQVQLYNEVLGYCDSSEDVTLKVVLAHRHPHIKWDYDELMWKTSFADIIATSTYSTSRVLPVMPWNFELLAYAPHMPIDEMEACKCIEWTCDNMTTNVQTYRDVIMRQHIDWDYEDLSWRFTR